MRKDRLKFLTYICCQLKDKEYILSLIAYNAAPTIENIKPSSLVVLKDDDTRKLYSTWKKNKQYIVNYLNLSFYELKENQNSVHILFYNEKSLNCVIKDEKNINFLKRFGYRKNMNVDESLKLLKRRFEKVCPHEIGIFLGYPISDVVDFVDCPNKQCLMRGYWKVYNDMENAKDMFKSYDQARNKVVNQVLKNNKLICC